MTCDISFATSIPSPLCFCAVGLAPLRCLIAPNAATILARRSQTDQGQVYGMDT